MATRRKPANHGGTKVRQRPRAVRASDTHYSGDLVQPLEPIVPPEHILRASPDEFAEFRARLDEGRMAEIRRRLDLLFAHYKLDRDDFIGLALALAFAHVPGVSGCAAGASKGQAHEAAKRSEGSYPEGANDRIERTGGDLQRGRHNRDEGEARQAGGMDPG